MNCGLAFIANKFVGIHVYSVSSFGDKNKRGKECFNLLIDKNPIRRNKNDII